MSETPDPRLGLTVTHRRYVPYAHAHYGGDLVDGAYTLGLFGDVATEVAIRTDGDEGLLAGYSEVRFLAPVQAGDVLEASCEVVRVGRRSRELRCTARVVARAHRADPTGAFLLVVRALDFSWDTFELVLLLHPEGAPSVERLDEAVRRYRQLSSLEARVAIKVAMRE